MASNESKYINMTTWRHRGDGDTPAHVVWASGDPGNANAHLAAPAPSGHPWSWGRWSVCSPCSGGGPRAARWSPARGAPRVWAAPPSDRWPIPRSPVPSTSPGPGVARSPSRTRRWPRAGKESRVGLLDRQAAQIMMQFIPEARMRASKW